MSELIATLDEPLAAPQALRLDELCDRFEAAWKRADSAAPSPRIEDFVVAEGAESERAVLLQELILLDIDYRRLRGEMPKAEDYRPRFPTLPDQFLAELFAAPPTTPPGSPSAHPPAEWWTTVSAPPFSPQLRADRYAIRNFHARGGIGEIWLAEDTEIGRPVALKRLRKRVEEQQERFLIEARITGQLEHPGIVPVHDLGVDAEGRPFYVMTFIHGRTLKDVIDEYHTRREKGVGTLLPERPEGCFAQKGPDPFFAAGRSDNSEPPEVRLCRLLEVFVKVCEAIAYAHNRGVIHRDLKPDNIMLGPYGETLVLDWGLAKICSQPEKPGSDPVRQLTYFTGSSKTQAGLVMGSPSYMPPEMADGHAADADGRTDVYLLGATLYHILTGRAPRSGRNLDEIIELARTVVPPTPRQLKADVPRSLEAICLKAMAHAVADRYPSALELARDVERYLAGAPVVAYPEPLLSRAWRWCKRHQRALTRSLAAAALLAVVLVGWFVISEAVESARADRRAAEEREETAQREAEQLRRRDEIRRDLAIFERLNDERQFYAASTAPAGDHPFQYNTRRSEQAAEKALELGDKLNAAFNHVEMPDARAAFQKQFHDLLLLTVQAQSLRSPDPEAVQAMLARLERAAELLEPSPGYFRLRARCYQLVGDTRRHDEEMRQADDPRLQATVLDHFLLAEKARMEAAPALGNGDAASWQPNPERLNQAIAHYQAALSKEPGHYWCHFQLGRCYQSLGKGSEAIEALGTCVALRPQLPWSYSTRGLALGLTRRYADADRDFERALAIEQDFRPALLNRGVVAWVQGKPERALEDLGKALALPAEKRLIEAAYYRGLIFAGQQKFREALEDFDRVARESPNLRFVYLSRAQLHFLQDDPRGLADLTTFLELGAQTRLDPKGHVVHALRGRLLRQLVPKWGLTPKQTTAALQLAREQLSQAIDLGNRSPETLDDLGSVLEFLRQPQEALDAYTRALAASPPRDLEVKILLKRGWIFTQSLEMPQLDKAQEAFTAVLRLETTNSDARAGLGYLAVLRKSAPEAQQEAAKALLNGAGDDYLALHNLACIYAELAEIDKGQAKQHEDVAIAFLRRAIELWQRGGKGPSEIELIKNDPALRRLRDRLELKKLIG